MDQNILLPFDIQELFRCPVCSAKLKTDDNKLRCSNIECSSIFPIIDGIPVLFNADKSIFSANGLLNKINTPLRSSMIRRTIRVLERYTPSISKNIKGKANYKKFAGLLGKLNSPKVLVIGGRILGQGMDALRTCSSIRLIETDVDFGPRTALICDAHNIPFENDSFDGVIVQAVLEHVADPYKCVEEIYRVLKTDGFVYSEIPFMQQVHAGPHDFTRFTHLGHRRLFRKFEEIESGAQGGPGMALAWAYKYFLLSFAKSRGFRHLIRAFAHLTSFYLKYFDYYLIGKPGTFDAASGYYFMGQKTSQILNDRELIKLYRGLM